MSEFTATETAPDPYAYEPEHGVDFLGTENASQIPSILFEQRRQRCYELAGYAVAFGTAPAGSLLVHGSWTGPVPKERIGHAWVLLPDGCVWEPIRARIYADRAEFYDWTKAWDERTYALSVVRRNLASSGHFGRWHESRYP